MRKVTIREAQDAAGAVGWDRTREIVGVGGLSGATQASLTRLVEEAEENARVFTRKDTTGSGVEVANTQGTRFEVNPEMDWAGHYTGTFTLVKFSPGDSRGRNILRKASREDALRELDQQLGQQVQPSRALVPVSHVETLPVLFRPKNEASAKSTEKSPRGTAKGYTRVAVVLRPAAQPGRTVLTEMWYRGEKGTRKASTQAHVVLNPRRDQQALLDITRHALELPEPVRASGQTWEDAGIHRTNDQVSFFWTLPGFSQPLVSAAPGAMAPRLYAPAKSSQPKRLAGNNDAQRASRLDPVLAEYGYKSTVTSLEKLARNRAVRAERQAGFAADVDYLQEKFGGENGVKAKRRGSPAKPGKAPGARRESSPDQKGYNYYVVVTRHDGRSIATGNEYLEDAKEALQDIRGAYPGGETLQVLTRTGLVRQGLDPKKSSSWQPTKVVPLVESMRVPKIQRDSKHSRVERCGCANLPRGPRYR